MTGEGPLTGLAGRTFGGFDRALERHRARLELREIGRVAEVASGVARVEGFTRMADGEVIRFPGGVLGIAANVDVDSVGVILLGERELKIIYAPGHAPHQMCIYDAKSQGIFSGEALGTPQIESSAVWTDAGFDLDAALETIDKLSKLNPKI